MITGKPNSPERTGLCISDTEETKIADKADDLRKIVLVEKH